ncbi:AAA-domain-containing protein [Penicillium taxi]|uniref:AAA-domain-containing protein n=1 Tax=Penicillium taxi TaxID=168475 RepID=UPI0025454224|nr:AAA-domain-containing protein [Penicillium taxi]KAJ5895300.1 AAA-domain-containing protein [Penicillium taxi]
MAPPGDRGGGPWLRFAHEMGIMLFSGLLAYGGVRLLLNHIIQPDASTKQAEEQRQKSTAILRKIYGGNRSDEDSTSSRHDNLRQQIADLDLNQYEQIISTELIAPWDIQDGFEDIGGLDHIIKELEATVIYPLTYPHLFASKSSLLKAPSGVLLYGPPGCGKTMLAKALARESGASFINLNISTLTEKWYGDSNKLVKAVFSLARKLQPAIVFIDEIDAVLGTRRSGEHEASGMVKAEFMTHWDGLTSANSLGEPQQIVILGATNRIFDIDEAILRRMPKKFPVTLPQPPQQIRILKLALKDTEVDWTNMGLNDLDLDTLNFRRKENPNLDRLLTKMDGMSGSAIKEMCREAAMVPRQEAIQTAIHNARAEMRARGQDPRALSLRKVNINPRNIRSLMTDDFFTSAGDVVVVPPSNHTQTAAIIGKDEAEWRTETESGRSSGMDEPLE